MEQMKKITDLEKNFSASTLQPACFVINSYYFSEYFKLKKKLIYIVDKSNYSFSRTK